MVSYWCVSGQPSQDSGVRGGVIVNGVTSFPGVRGSCFVNIVSVRGFTIVYSDCIFVYLFGVFGFAISILLLSGGKPSRQRTGCRVFLSFFSVRGISGLGVVSRPSSSVTVSGVRHRVSLLLSSLGTTN